MKAALYFDSAAGFGEWHVLISTRADRNLRETCRKDKKSFNIIVKKIKELSNGHFSEDNQKRLAGSDNGIPIFEAKMTRDSRLVYQIDCVPEYDSDVERQVIRIFGIYTHAQLDNRLWDSMSHQLMKRGKEYKHRCTFRNRPRQVGDNVIMPASFPPQEAVEEVVSGLAIPIPSEYLEEVIVLSVLEKFVTLSQVRNFNGIFADHDVAHVFSVSPKEKEIIEHTSSCFVLGRSGTGKTTTMLFKMLGIERSWQLHSGSMIKPRQLFVTRSRVLAGRVEEYFTKLMQSLALQGTSAKELMEIVKKKVGAQQASELMIDVDDESDWRSDLPRHFSQLQDEHFPLFITFDRLCMLLEADARLSYKHTSDSPGLIEACSSPSQDNDDRSTISYDTFFDAYWCHFPQSLIKGLDPALVFSEFMGVIKGSEEALSTTERFLDQKTYVKLSHRSQSTFSMHRDVIYKLFEQYMKRKKGRGDQDMADKSQAILDFISREGVPGERIDFLYVDEVQDNLLIDIPLLRALCKNPDGMFWAGDTAQAFGSSFKFDALKAFLYRIEREFEQKNKHIRPQLPPRSFQLAVNYRSHGGIVGCAQSVIRLITEFFPYSIDKLADEKGIIDGAKPVLFAGWDENTVRYESFLFGDRGTRIEFGAQQCILVRNEVAKEKLRKEVGDVGLIMTLYESKGLEFDDVLLYNFFEDSTVDVSHFRIVLNALEDRDLQKSSLSAHRFDETRHAGVCSELKFLYVAITRARKNLWIVDYSKKAEPMKIFWTSLDLVQICTPGADVPQLAVSSTPEEWRISGRSLFQHKRYYQAMHCFTRAGLEREASVTHAYHLRELARGHPLISLRRSESFLVAAEAFLLCTQSSKAPKEKRAYFKAAADCFVHCGDDTRAAKAFVDASEFTLAAQHYRKAGKFHDAVQVIDAHRSQMNEAVVDKIIQVSRLYFVKESKLDDAIKLFSSYEEGLEFLEDYDLDVARATLLEKMGRLAEAAELHLAEGRQLEAIRLFIADRENIDSEDRAKKCLVDCLWQQLSFGRSKSADNSHLHALQELLHRVSDSRAEAAEMAEDSEVLMFKAISDGNTAQLLKLGLMFHGDRNAAALLCLDNAFVSIPKIQVAKGSEVSSSLGLFHIYTKVLGEAARHPDPYSNARIQKLLDFHVLAEGQVLVKKETFLHDHCMRRNSPIIRSDDGDLIMSRWDFLVIYRNALSDRLRTRVLAENGICEKAKALFPCLSFAAFKYCNNQQCDRDHLDSPALTNEAYHMRVQLHLQQVLIVQSLHFVMRGDETRRLRIAWITRLYEALNPPYHMLGHISNLDLTRIPDAQQGCQVVIDWLRDLLYTLDPRENKPTFLSMASILAGLSLDFDSDAAYSYVRQAPFAAPNGRLPPELLRNKSAFYVINDLIEFLEDKKQYSLTLGILFLNHVLDNTLCFSLDILCDYTDHLCASIVVHFLHRKWSSLHGITLPRSYLIRALKRFDRTPRDTHLMELFCRCLGELLGRVFTTIDSDHLVYEGQSIWKHSDPIRNAFIARICRCMCLLGYNIRDRDERLRKQIFTAITTLRKDGRFLPTICYRYISARGWEDLARHVRQSARDSNLDEMVQLHDLSRVPLPNYTVSGVRLVAFKRSDDIVSLLTSPETLTSKSSTLKATAAAFTPQQTISSPAKAALAPFAEDNPVEEEDKHDVEETDLDVVGQNPEGQEIMGYQTYKNSNTDAAFSEEHIKAATTFMILYKQLLRRRRKAPKHGLASHRAQVFTTYQDASCTIEWPNGYYRLLFLGPLPHIMVCLERVVSYAKTAKDNVKKRLTRVEHQELEEVSERLTKMTSLLKNSKRLQKTLEPKSELHRRRDLQELESSVSEVELLVQQLPQEKRMELQEDLNLGWTGIVKKLVKVKKPKPLLEVDDIEDDMY
ncbi:hypothetical protein SERLA73DRAFT_114784 [Serpula lacrymans var. lacrymans S7.3]|uniref:UvrD-like helicase ATP-binding domain-containing protein n=1 Tax=Serpula lacrymans var. lacrymans (strain S7.3) TaxID=936435 RepID=F8QBE3_SERL3|nr:hypothetical protein SERLA73DRAFT_114784 [Serpula lacrymans var. lacrymans S7.3]